MVERGQLWLAPVLMTVALCGVFFSPMGVLAATPCPNANDYIDPTYRSSIRQLLDRNGDEHNIYYFRNPWNADNTYMVGIQSDLNQANWRVVLYDGNGCYIKDLFAVDAFDWRLVWDRNDPAFLYTWNGSALYRFNVNTNSSELLKSFAPLAIAPIGPSLSQAGDRILVVTSDNVLRSYRLGDMQDERAFTVTYPAGCTPPSTEGRYIGYRNYISTSCTSGDFSQQATLIYNDDGVLFHQFDGIGGGGHYDFSPDGKLAYFFPWTGGGPLEIHVVNIDGTNDRVVFSAPNSEILHVQNLHLSWPDEVTGWFIASLFPSAANVPATYAPLLDEIIKINTDGSHSFLARTYTEHSPGLFWAQPLASPSADGFRISFNSIRSGSVDQFILFTRSPVGTPDLVIAAVSSPPNTAEAGTSFSVSNSVHNQGTAEAMATSMRYYLSLNPVKGAGDILLSGFQAVPPLTSGASWSGRATVTIPAATLPGTYFLLACADDTQLVSEGNETNNCAAATETLRLGRRQRIPARQGW